MLRATDIAHAVLRQVIGLGDWVVDATVGNGHDTALLAALVGPEGRVFGCDIQAVAVAAASARLRGLAQVELVQAGHELMAAWLPTEACGRLAAVVFNLGYLPGGDKTVMTHTETTLVAVRQALDALRVGGVVTVVLYPGHVGGEAEAEAVQAFARALPATFAATHMTRANAVRPAPELLMIERRG
jgi:predicted methyltransferase